MIHIRTMAALPLLILALPANSNQGAAVEVSFERLRNARGDLHLCLTRLPAHFPDCSSDPNAVKRTIPAATPSVRLNIAPAEYAVSVFHDENRNRDLDTFLGIPREGFGFSRNPRVRFGAPRFNDVRIGIVPGMSRLAIRMQYLL